MNKGKIVCDCALKLDNVVKVYGEGENSVRALKGISVSFRKNEFVSVLGPSGCGKTTLLNIIGGLDRYTDGDLVINGKSTKEYKDADWDTYRNESIGFIFQSYNLIPHQTVLSNVELALTLSGVSNAERKKRAKEVLAKVGLNGLEHKLPNQMSGGQMQRVAIARALVNDPEIILADEPTGALDTETSVQVMELLKEVAKDRLVIMVTHNPELAKKYSTRIINLLDGEMTDDTAPFDYVLDKEETQKSGDELKKKKKEKKKMSSMSIWTAFSLSVSNLFTKKGRTILTSVAGSIGIIGIALVLAVSTGFSSYIQNLQSETLSVYPVTISEATIDISDFEKLTNKVITDEDLAQKLSEKVYTKEMFGNLTNMLKSNKLTEEYISYVDGFAASKNEEAKSTGENWKYCVQKGYGFDTNDFIFSNIGWTIDEGGSPAYSVMSVNTLVEMLENMFNEGMKASNMNISAEFVREYIPTVCEMPENQYLLDSQYDLLYGEWATEKDELVLVVDGYNRVSDITLALLGFRTIEGINNETYSVKFGGNEEFTFEEILQKEFYYISNNDRYMAHPIDEHTYITRSFKESTIPETALKLKVKGIVRLKDRVSSGVLNTGIAYTSAFNRYVIESNANSDIVLDARNGHEESGKTVNTVSVSSMNGNKTFTERSLGGSGVVSKLSLYSVDYQSKEDFKAYLDLWNDAEGRVEEDKVHYSDSTALLFSAMNSIVDAVKIVLICFTSISLVVSSIMIGIITYVSVVERTKEIGVLRSIGARKKDISRIFNAETFLIGLFAGVIGIVVTYLLSIPINLIISSFIVNAGRIAALKITDAFVLVVVSFVLTLIAGLIPSKIAAKKDPVIALRSE